MLSVKAYVPPSLDSDTIARLRAPPDRSVADALDEDSDDSDDIHSKTGPVPGAFPGPPDDSNGAYY